MEVRMSISVTSGSRQIQIKAPGEPSFDEVLTGPAIEFVSGLIREFAPRVDELLARRRGETARIRSGGSLGFRPDTARVREGDWTVAPIPADLRDRRVEITGPTDRKMIINALNSGAAIFMADFE